jgi:hypothetical protein
MKLLTAIACALLAGCGDDSRSAIAVLAPGRDA